MRPLTHISAAVLLLAMLVAPASRAGALTDVQRSWYVARLADNDAGRDDRTAAGVGLPLAPDPLAEKLVTWDRLRRPQMKATLSDYTGLLTAAPGWPLETLLRRLAETAVSNETPAADRLAFFGRFPPRTATGKLRYAESLVSTQPQRAASLARDAWVMTGLALVDEQALLGQFGAALTPADHAMRADRLLWAGQTTAAMRLLDLLAPDERMLAAARLALIRQDQAAMTLVAQVPAALRGQGGLIYDTARYYRRARLDGASARATLLKAKVDPDSILDSRAWTAEIQLLAAQAQSQGLDADAYRLLDLNPVADDPRRVAAMDVDDRVAFTDLEWASGWLALRQLNRPLDAVRHFQAVYTAGQHPVTQSRAAYWAARAAEAAKDAALARVWYQRAVVFDDYFYGQLAADRSGLAPPAPPATLAAPPVAPSTQARQAYEAQEVAKVASLLGELGDAQRQTLFLRVLVDQAKSPEQKRLLADFAARLGRPDVGVMLGRLPGPGADVIADAAFPRLGLAGANADDWTMIHAITRQESQFFPLATSHVGARGLMQLMPNTAAEVARKLGLPYALSSLTSDQNYNIQLGSSYFRRLLDTFDGNMVMAIAAYNAGGGRVRQWVRANGDPRDPRVDTLDWIERIPIRETRDYVQRVLENAVVYATLAPGARQASRVGLLSRYLAAGRAPQSPLSPSTPPLLAAPARPE